MEVQDLTKLDLPQAPGIYFWKKGRQVLYIGKATNLRDRVRSYFASDLIDTRGPGILDMVTQADTVSFEETPTVIEALILEANLIRKYQPKYNVKEKDDKSFFRLVITDEPWPRVIIVRSRDLKVMERTGRISRLNFEGKIRYSFGPYPSGTLLREALKIVRRIFPFRDDRSDTPGNERFYRQLGLSPDTSGERARKEYLGNIANIRRFFEGKKGAVVRGLERQMHTHAKRLEFEQAEAVKRRLFALNHINDVALIRDDPDSVHGGPVMRIEAYDIAHSSGSNTVGVMTVVRGGIVDKAEYRTFKIRSLRKGAVDDYASLREVVTRRLGHPEWPLPGIVVVDGGVGQYHAVTQVLRERGASVPVISVIKDARHRPKALHGPEDLAKKYRKEILLANSESHRFAIGFHRMLRGNDFLP